MKWRNRTAQGFCEAHDRRLEMHFGACGFCPFGAETDAEPLIDVLGPKKYSPSIRVHSRLRPWMCFVVRFLQPFDRNMSINLRGRKALMPKQRLNAA